MGMIYCDDSKGSNKRVPSPSSPQAPVEELQRHAEDKEAWAVIGVPFRV